MKKLIALTILAMSLTACPEKTPAKAVAEKEPSINELTKKLAAFKSDKPTDAKTKQTYTITYPQGWELKPRFMGTDTMALSMPENSSDQFRENVNVVIERVRVKNKKAYYDANLRTMKKMMTGFKIVSSTEMKLASGIQATNLVYLHKMGEISAKNRAVFVYENGTGYVITATAQPTTYEQYNPQFEKIVQSFRLN